MSRLHEDARRDWLAEISSTGAKLTGEQSRLAEASSEKEKEGWKEMASGLV